MSDAADSASVAVGRAGESQSSALWAVLSLRELTGVVTDVFPNGSAFVRSDVPIHHDLLSKPTSEVFCEVTGLKRNDLVGNHWATKRAWYDTNFLGRLVTTIDSGELTRSAAELIQQSFV